MQSLYIFIQNPSNGLFLRMQTNQSQTQLRCPSGFYNVHIYNVSTVYNVGVHNLGAEHRAVACADLSFADDLSHRRKPNALSQHRDVINIGPTQSKQWFAKTLPCFWLTSTFWGYLFIRNDSFILVLYNIVLLPGTNAKFHDITPHAKKLCPKQKVSDAK